MYQVYREIKKYGDPVRTHPVGKPIEGYGDALSFASFAASDHAMSHDCVSIKNLTNGFTIHTDLTTTVTYLVREGNVVSSNLPKKEAASSDLRRTVDDLEKVLDGLKKAKPDNWQAIMNANGDLMAVPILSALVQGYAELAKLGEV